MPFKNTEGLKLQTSSNGIQSLSTTEYFQKNPENRDEEQMYSWNKSLERRQWGGKQDFACPNISG